MKEKCYFILSMIIFGAAGLFAKYINMSSGKIALALSLSGTLFLSVIFIAGKKRIPWDNLRPNLIALIAGGLALSGNWICLFQAYKNTTIANAAISYYFAPILVILFSPLLLKEKASASKIIGVLVALTGLFLILQNSTPQTDSKHLLGIGYGLTAACFYTGLTIINKFIRELDGLTITILQLGLALLPLLLYIALTGNFSLAVLRKESVILLVAFGILHGGIGFYCFYSGIKGLSAQSIAILSYIDPLTSLIISIIILHEPFTLPQLAGTILLLGSILLTETQIINIRTLSQKFSKND